VINLNVLANHPWTLDHIVLNFEYIVAHLYQSLCMKYEHLPIWEMCPQIGSSVHIYVVVYNTIKDSLNAIPLLLH